MILPKVCYLSTGIMDTAFDSQVFPLLETALKSQFNLIHFAFNPFRFKTTERYLKKKEELESKGIKTYYFQQAPPIFKRSLIMDVKRIHPCFKNWLDGKERVVIHCRGHLNAYRGLTLKRESPNLITIIADLRGAVTDEVMDRSRGVARNLFAQYLSKLYQRIEDQVVRNADTILCVSDAFKAHLQTNYRIKNVIVIPTFVDVSQFNFNKALRDLHRKKIGISNRTVLVYSGGVAPWQKLENVVNLFVNLKQIVNNLFMLFLTHEPNLLMKVIKGQIQPDDVRVIQVPHAEVAGYLCAADVGVLLREDTLTNHVAAPIKFSEYMCCGLPCIVSDKVGDTAEVIRKEKAGIVLEGLREAPKSPEFQKLLVLNREEISNRMSKRYASSLYIPEILKLYRTLAEKRPPFSLDAC